MRGFILFLVVLLGASLNVFAQKGKVGERYTFAMLTQEPITIVNEFLANDSKEVGDTSFTIYSDGDLSFSTYFVNGAQYDNIFNPHPTGIYINGKEYFYYCGLEKSIRQNYANILEAYEFTYLGGRYLMIINFREECMGSGCRYLCYNVFDISDLNKISQISFSSLYQGKDSFGDFNNDGVLDFVRTAPKPPKDAKEGEFVDHYLITAYTINKGRPKQLNNATGHAYYMYVKGDEEVKSFEVLQADWFMPLKDTSGQFAEPKAYFAEYIAFDPLYRHLYNPDGVRIEKNRYSVLIADLNDLEAAQEYCRKMQNNNISDVFIMIDQYSGDIKFQVLAGNFVTKDNAMDYKNKLKDIGYPKTEIIDFRQAY
jgi:hypothetical protein